MSWLAPPWVRLCSSTNNKSVCKSGSSAALTIHILDHVKNTFQKIDVSPCINDVSDDSTLTIHCPVPQKEKTYTVQR